MRAILIDPEKQTISEIQVEVRDDSDIGYIRTALGCRSFTTGSHPLTGSMAKGFDALYVSDDDLEDADNPRFWFQVDADRDPPSSYPIAGRGLVVGTDKEGEDCDARISVADLTPRITFTQRKFRGFEVHTGAEARARGADVVVEVNAPVIDGTAEK